MQRLITPLPRSGPWRGSRPATAGLLAFTVGVAGALAVGVPTSAVAAEPDVPDGAWTDPFDGVGLGPDWTVVNPAPEALSVADGSLTLTSQTGDTYQDTNTAKNIVMLDVPDGDFTLVTHVDAPVSKTFQGAGLIAWQDIDNYVRSGLTFVGDLAPSGRAIENDIESDGSFSAYSFADRPGSAAETLRMQRTGDVVVTSYWDDDAWTEAGTVTVDFPITQVGVYALAAQDGTTHTAAFDYVALDAAEGADQVPDGTFTVTGPGTSRYLVATEDGLALDDERPSSTVALTATEVEDPAEGTRPVTLGTDGGPVVVQDDRLALGEPGAPGEEMRITDAGGGKVWLRSAADPGLYVGVRADDGALVLGPRDSATALTVTATSSADHEITVDLAGERTEMSDELYGIFYEDINYAADGGLYAELVRNRSFEFDNQDNGSFNGLTAWSAANRGGATATTQVVNDAGRLNATNRNYLNLTTTGAGAGVRNAGYNTGQFVEEGESYDFSVWARSATAQTLTVRVEDAAGTTAYATGEVAVDGSDAWKKYEVTLDATGTTTAGRLAVLAGAAGTVNLDMVSLFPQDTWEGAVNGKSPLRKDLAEKIEALNPKFLRFPGGCVTNVGTFDSYEESGYTDRQRTYQWKETIGPVEERATNWNFWGYNQSYGIGYLEYFEFAEDMGATALPVVSVGANGCGSTIPEMTDPVQIQRWVDDTVDLIEFANGDVTTEWGAVRAELGHPEPFGMKYIGLGNEENTHTFEANFPQFRDAIEAAYPDIEIISNSGPDDTGARFDELWEFNREQGVDMVDEHYYNDPSWFLENDERYDSYDREGPHVFLGEYASRGNTFANALAEASFMTGLERNSDVVELASYAPLLANESYVQWSPDAIWFDNDESWGSVNYYVQQMFSANVGDQVVPSTHTGPPAEGATVDGGVFLSTWSTAAQYDNVRVTDNASGDVLFEDDFEDGADQWQPQSGTWAAQDGAYVQSATDVTDARSIIEGAYAKDWSSYTLELDARKTSGSEGFLVGFAAGAANDYYWWNLGGWNNTRQALQRADGGSANEVTAVENSSIESGQPYHVKVVVEGSTIELYLDGELQMSYAQPAKKSLYQVVTRDDDTGDVVVKVVNPTATAARTQVHVEGAAGTIDDTATVTEMVGAPSDTNTKADPERVVPVERTLTGIGEDFSYEFPASSITFVRLHESAAPGADVTLEVTAQPRCLAGKAYVAVRAVNGEDVPVDVELATPFGARTFADVAAGKNAYQSFAVRATSVPAGSVTVTGAGDLDGEHVTTPYDVAYDALDCG
ncbi:alpha-L-arabinofuranosidase C-terminal domain-containing protein [Cellulosimicrobium arenosum]|uniref:non-reducing end alpha-L-arabinofuranosidase n=1 Tax=Cellulosimicrobium arenosum TaxID=2708133 RepID=A0A927J048_9MICO|nr:alpha-L-arabinofuranosidase C-terminal domain-containing protein [Cellulosimicrobium arenosum]MBD8079464.1 carbohydrate binding domain-containing protein [Cellulosimicrobium arenosum]